LDAERKFLFSQDNNNITIENIILDMNENTFWSDDFERNPCAIWLEGGTDHTVSHCQVWGAQNDAIVIKTCTTTVVKNCTIGPIVPAPYVHQRANSISVEGAMELNYDFRKTLNIEIYGNRIYRNDSHMGINLDINLPDGFNHQNMPDEKRNSYCENTKIYGNIIESCENGIFVRHHKAEIFNNIIYTNFKSIYSGGVDETDEGHGIRFAYRFLLANLIDHFIWWADSRIYNNTIYYNYNVGINFNEAKNCILYNNLISHNGNSGSYINGWHSTRITQVPTGSIYTVDKNLHWGNQNISGYFTWGSNDIPLATWNLQPGVADDLWGNPQFETVPNLPWDNTDLNPSPYILYLLAGSPAINTGKDLSSFPGYSNTDILGNIREPNAWDIGAYEYQLGADEMNIEQVSLNSLKLMKISLSSEISDSSLDKKHFSIIGNKIKKVTKLGPKNISLELVQDLDINKNYLVLLKNVKNIHGKEIKPQFASLLINSGLLPKKNSIGVNSFDFNLSQNFPNPFNPVTSLSYSIPYQSPVQIKVYDILGREIQTLTDEIQPEGTYSINFDGSDLSSGTYFYSLTAGDYHSSKKMILLK
jgi:parallel beta-helix repeat protein